MKILAIEAAFVQGTHLNIYKYQIGDICDGEQIVDIQAPDEHTAVIWFTSKDAPVATSLVLNLRNYVRFKLTIDTTS